MTNKITLLLPTYNRAGLLNKWIFKFNNEFIRKINRKPWP